MILSILSVLSPIRGKVLALFLFCPSWPVSKALEEKVCAGISAGALSEIHLSWFKPVGAFFQQCWSVCLRRHRSCCIPDLLMTLELLCSYSSHVGERLQMSSRKVTLPCRKKNPSYPHLYGPIPPKNKRTFALQLTHPDCAW